MIEGLQAEAWTHTTALVATVQSFLSKPFDVRRLMPARLLREEAATDMPPEEVRANWSAVAAVFGVDYAGQQ